ncbi:MAG: LamG domain-containing protein [Nannocystaceae bacterium]
MLRPASVRLFALLTALCACFTDSGADGSGAAAASGETGVASSTTAETTTTSGDPGSTAASEGSTTTKTTSTTSATSTTTGDLPTTATTTEATTSTGTTGDASPLCADDPELVACYEFDDGFDGFTLQDGSSYGNDGTKFGVAESAGIVGSGVLVAATSQIVVPEAPSLVITGPYTVAAWFRADQLPEVRAGIVDRAGNYGVFYGADAHVQCRVTGFTVAAEASLGAWHHVACVFDGASLGLFVDGELRGKTALDDLSAGSGPLVLANDSPEPLVEQALVGALDRVHVWSRALTLEELCADYPNACP